MSLASRVAARHLGQGLALRVATRYVEAFQFETDKEREKYLKEHPGADPSRHTVKKQKGAPGKAQPPPKPKKPGVPAPEVPQGKPPGEHPEEKPPGEHKTEPPEKKPPQGEHPEEKPGEHPETPKKKVVETLKGLSRGALNFLKKAPEGVKKFFQDDAHRRTVLMKLHSAIGRAPGKMAQNLIKTAKEEVHEFKTAGEGVKASLSGKKMSKHQKHAVRTVAIHMGITAAAAALSATGLTAGLAFAAKAMARHVALKSVHRTFEHLHTASELHHIGHGILELMDKFASKTAAGEDDPEQVLAAIVMKSVQEELANMSEDDLREMLEHMAKSGAGQMKEAADTTPPGEKLADLCEQAETVHKALRTMIRAFPQVLKEAGHVLDSQTLVWQDAFIPYWRKMDASLQALTSIDDEIEGVYLSLPRNKMALQTMANVARDATADRLIPKTARIEFAFGNPQFQDGRIAYHVDRLKKWAEAFETWNEKSIEVLHQTARKARRSV